MNVGEGFVDYVKKWLVGMLNVDDCKSVMSMFVLIWLLGDLEVVFEWVEMIELGDGL